MNGNLLNNLDIKNTDTFFVHPLCKLDRRGFTLIELMIVVSIIGILAAIAVPNYQWGIIKAKEAVLREALYNFRNTIDQFYADQGKYPDSKEEIVSKGYMRELPKDPFTNSNSTWVDEAPPPPPVTPDSGFGAPTSTTNMGNLYNVKSGSDKVSPTNNIPYREW